ncbi:MAG TPA: hypothetical protein VNE00_17615 [Paraburkholderia sp.]|jgi:hypothetical protein|nr:hypothetical protein [Paraburkholderia sp.]
MATSIPPTSSSGAGGAGDSGGVTDGITAQLNAEGQQQLQIAQAQSQLQLLQAVGEALKSGASAIKSAAQSS